MAHRHIESHVQSACTMLAEKHDARFASTYGEPGYSDTERGIILSNWNDIPKGLADWLESVGFSLEWSDEWEEVNDKAYRTSPDCYSWIPQLHLTTDGEWLTPDDDASAWIDEIAISDAAQPIYALPDRITAEELADAGFILHANNCQSGLHNGMTDDPQALAREAFKTEDGFTRSVSQNRTKPVLLHVANVD